MLGFIIILSGDYPSCRHITLETDFLTVVVVVAASFGYTIYIRREDKIIYYLVALRFL